MIVVLGWIMVALLAVVLPRTVLVIIAGVYLGGGWWFLLGPVAVVTFLIDASA